MNDVNHIFMYSLPIYISHIYLYNYLILIFSIILIFMYIKYHMGLLAIDLLIYLQNQYHKDSVQHRFSLCITISIYYLFTSILFILATINCAIFKKLDIPKMLYIYGESIYLYKYIHSVYINIYIYGI